MPQSCFSLGPHLLPLAVFITLPGTFIITYVIAISLGHTEIDFPYISDTGTKSPESCIFAQLLNIGAVLVAICVYIRYCQIKEYNAGGPPFIRKFNILSVWTGMIAAFGISLVGNFQESNVIVVHVIGASMAFGLGLLYAWFNTYLTYKMSPRMNGKAICHLRLLICLVATITFITMWVADTIARTKFHGRDAKLWHPTDGGYTEHLVSTFSEWTMALVFMMYFLTFINEFRKVSMTLPVVTLEVNALLSSTQLDPSTDVLA